MQSSSSSTTVRRSPWTARGRRSTRSCASKPCRRKRATRHLSQRRRHLSHRLRYIPTHFHAAWCRRRVPACLHVHVDSSQDRQLQVQEEAWRRSIVTGTGNWTTIPAFMFKALRMSPAETLEAYCAAASEPTEVPTPEVHTHPHSTTTHNTHLRNTHNMTADSVPVECQSAIRVPDSTPSGTVGGTRVRCRRFRRPAPP